MTTALTMSASLVTRFGGSRSARMKDTPKRPSFMVPSRLAGRASPASWADVSLGKLAGGGELTISAPQGAKSISLSKASGGVFATKWDKLRDVVTIPIIKQVAVRLVHLVLALGQHDPDYVDAFYGPAEWKTQAEKEKKSLDAIGAEAAELNATLAKAPDAATSGDEMLKLRHEYFAETGCRVGSAGADVGGRKIKVR